MSRPGRWQRLLVALMASWVLFGFAKDLTPAATFGDLFICAKDLFVGAKHGLPAKLRHRSFCLSGRVAFIGR